MRERPQCTLVAELPEVRRKQSTVDEAPAWYTFCILFLGNAAIFRELRITDYRIVHYGAEYRIRSTE